MCCFQKVLPCCSDISNISMLCNLVNQQTDVVIICLVSVYIVKLPVTVSIEKKTNPIYLWVDDVHLILGGSAHLTAVKLMVSSQLSDGALTSFFARYRPEYSQYPTDQRRLVLVLALTASTNQELRWLRSSFGRSFSPY